VQNLAVQYPLNPTSSAVSEHPSPAIDFAPNKLSRKSEQDKANTLAAERQRPVQRASTANTQFSFTKNYELKN